MGRNRIPIFLLALLLGMVSIQCGRSEYQSTELPRDETLYIGGIQWGEPTSFNPLLEQASWPCRMPNNLVYETLLLYDPIKGKNVPGLAESYRETDDGIEITLHKKARWSDGKPVTAWDVLFTFELGQKYKNVPTAPVWEYLEDVRLPDVSQGMSAEQTDAGQDYPRTVLFTLNKERNNPLVVLDALQSIFIIPRHIHEATLASFDNDIHKFLKLKLDKDPVASGPYRLYSYSAEKIIVVRNENYWGNEVFFNGQKPAPKYIVHLLYKSNDHFSIGLQQGRLDATSTFIPRIWLKNRKKVYSWFEKEPFYPSASIPMFYINGTKPPLDDPQFRRAMAFSVNYKDVRELAVSGYSLPLQPGLILPFGLESKYFFEEDAKKYGATFDPEQAKTILKQAGYSSTFDDDGRLIEMRDPNGKKIPGLEITSPSGWTDWESVVRIAVKSMRAVGIDVRERFVDGNVYWPSLPKGEFDLIMHTPTPEATPSMPWSRFEYLLTSAGWVPPGEKMYKNLGRFNNPDSPAYKPRVDELLQMIPSLRTEKERILAYRELNRLFMELQPTIPLVYKPEQFFQYSVRHWKNFPNGNHPYAPAFMPGYRIGTRTLWTIEPAYENEE